MQRIGGNQKLIVGYDLGWDYAQISYCTATSGQVETVSSVAGSENFSIPTALCKKVGANQWSYGREALAQARDGQGILTEGLLALALAGEPVYIEETEYDPIALLTLFFKRTLGMLASVAGTDKLEAMMVTCDQMNDETAAVLDKVTANLRLKIDKVSYQSHQESYYDYLSHQPGDLWKEPSELFHYQGSSMICYRMECNKKTKPVVTFIHREVEEFPARDSVSAKAEEGNRILDRTFLQLAQEKIGNGRTASVYLIGDDFSEDWLKSSLTFLCDRRRIFLGNNLFSKGACHGMLERTHPSGLTKEYVFLGDDKLKCNIGMTAYRQGEETYVALLDAGEDWRSASSGMEFYLRQDHTVELTVTSLVGGGRQIVELPLEGLSGDVSRIRMTLGMKAENVLHAEFFDLGFGEFRAAENRSFEMDVNLT